VAVLCKLNLMLGSVMFLAVVLSVSQFGAQLRSYGWVYEKTTIIGEAAYTETVDLRTYLVTVAYMLGVALTMINTGVALSSWAREVGERAE
jgi:hypothetical protein